MNKASLTILKAAIEVVVVLFGAFGGILTKLFPDLFIANIEFITGMAQFISLAIFLFCSVYFGFQLLKTQEGQKKIIRIWLWVSGGMLVLIVVCSALYYSNFNSLVVRQEKWQINIIRGNELTEDSKSICKEESKMQNAAGCETYLLNEYYNADEVLNKNLLWTKESVQHSTNLLLINYLALIICLSLLLFSLIELLTWPLLKKEE